MMLLKIGGCPAKVPQKIMIYRGLETCDTFPLLNLFKR
jgi:hypothetical protein